MSFETTGEAAEDEKTAQCQKLLQRCIRATVESADAEDAGDAGESKDETTPCANVQVCHFFSKAAFKEPGDQT